MRETRISDIEPEISEWDGLTQAPFEIDGRDPDGLDHLCIRDLELHDGPVEECCINQWRDEGALP